ncbi:MAG: hypothetical protein BGO69_12340 [Bacteroidetes bacterium 46-16]|nr:MAG: hypothetical protein BGO69_12340 [Bacteroidetes bacterium 46-16]
MITTYHLNVNELSLELINSIKAAFKDKDIEITVTEALDETGYLLSSEANRTHLTQSMNEVKNDNTVVLTVEEMQQKYGK